MKYVTILLKSTKLENQMQALVLYLAKMRFSKSVGES